MQLGLVANGASSLPINNLELGINSFVVLLLEGESVQCDSISSLTQVLVCSALTI